MPDPICWSLPSSTSPLAPDAVHVWHASLRADAELVERLGELLSADEQERAACFRFERDRREFIVARGTLRVVLSRYLDTHPEDLTFRYGPYGKPELATPTDLQFNLTHAGEVALIAVTRDRQLGVDVEPVRVLPDADRIVERFFSAQEVEAYRSLPASTRPAAFFACWTRKEAFIKALGDGLTHPLDAFDVTVRPEEPAMLLRVRGATEPSPWYLEALPVGPGYAATVAVQGDPCVITCWNSAGLVDDYAHSLLASS